MHIELKKAIIGWMFEHKNEYQLFDATAKEFRQYLYTDSGAHCIGGKEVSEFISTVIKHILNFEQTFELEKS